MSITSEITRLQGVKANILQAIADKGVEVPSGSMLADCPDLIASISGNNIIYKEQIKNTIYHYVKIKDKFFTIESLKESFNGVYSGYVENNPYSVSLSSNGVFGQYYNNLCISIIQNWLESNSNGWRIATKEDFEDLLTFNPADLEHVETWNHEGIVNKTMFSAFQCGYFNGSTHSSSDAYFLTQTKENDKYYYLVLQEDRIYITNTYDVIRNAYCIRLCKDSS